MLYHKTRRHELRFSRIITVTIFWIMFAFSITLSLVLVNHCSKIHMRQEMVFINYNLVPLAKMAQGAPDEMKSFINFNIHCMLLHVKDVKQTLELYILAVLFFNLNSLIILFVAYNKKRKFLMVMTFVMIVFMFFAFTFSHRAVETMPKKVLGGMYLDNKMFE